MGALTGWLSMCLSPVVGWLLTRCCRLVSSAVAWLERGESIYPESGLPAAVSVVDRKASVMSVMIGIDPHKGSHTAVVIDSDEAVIEQIRVRASAKQVGELQEWASGYEERLTVDSAEETGRPNTWCG